MPASRSRVLPLSVEGEGPMEMVGGLLRVAHRVVGEPQVVQRGRLAGEIAEPAADIQDFAERAQRLLGSPEPPEERADVAGCLGLAGAVTEQAVRGDGVTVNGDGIGVVPVGEQVCL